MGLVRHLVCDNPATPKTEAVKEWLLRRPLFHLHFTPISSSWMSLVERWFDELPTRERCRSGHRTVTEIQADIRKWINTRNCSSRLNCRRDLDILAVSADKLTTQDIR
jgi:transposase